MFARMRASVTYCDCFCVFCVIFFTSGALKPLSIAFIIFNFEVLHVLKASLDISLVLLIKARFYSPIKMKKGRRVLSYSSTE